MPAGYQVICVCNHKEADVCLLFHSSKVDSDVVVVCKDTDILTLIIWAYSKLNITNKWYLKYSHEKFADIRKACSYLGKRYFLNLPKIHALTGCDTTSYFYRVRKIKILKKYLVNMIYVFYCHSSKISVKSPTTLSNIRRANLHVKIWFQSLNQNVTFPYFQQHGWKWCNEKLILVLVWFTGNQLPLTIMNQVIKSK